MVVVSSRHTPKSIQANASTTSTKQAMSWDGHSTTRHISKHDVTDGMTASSFGINNSSSSTSMMAPHPQQRSQLHQQQRPQYPMPPSPMLRRKHQQQRESQYHPPSSSLPHRNDGKKFTEYETISERIVDSFNQNSLLSSHHQHSYPTSLLLSPSRRIKQQESDDSHTSLSSYQPQHVRQQQQQQQPPFLTIVLMKIDQSLLTYCQHLSYPSHANAALACTLFDSVTGPMSRSSPMIPSGNNNSSKSTIPAVNIDDSTLSQPVSPIKRWFPLTGGPHHNHQPQRSPAPVAFPTQKLALENEWETYVSPFLLFAAAEVLYAKFVHLQQSPQHEQQQQEQQQKQQHQYPLFFNRNNHNQKIEDRIVVSSVVSLIELYQRIDQDLRYIQEILCEPFLRSDPTASTASLPFPQLEASTTQQRKLKDYHHNAATSVTESIRALSVIVSIRCQMITLQSLIFDATGSTDSKTMDDNVMDESDDENTGQVRSESSPLVPTFYDAASAATIWLQTVEATITTSLTQHETSTDDGNEAKETSSAQEQLNVLPLLQSLKKELNAWKYCFETCFALERCKFMDTIISLRYWQLHLPSKNNDAGTTTYANYMNESFQHIRSLLPIYFDRTRTYANHCYGINTSLSMKIDTCVSGKQNASGSTEHTDLDDYDSIIVDFLHQQDKLGSPSMAIGIVLDAMSTSNLHVERGFCIGVTTETSKSDDVRVAWPAVYLRSTMHLPPPTPPKSDTGGSGIFASSQGSLLSNWASVSIPGGSPFSMTSRKQPLVGISPTTTPPSHRTAKTLSLSSAPQLPFSEVAETAAATAAAALESNLHALEYGPESGTVTSWPHNEWASIARILYERRCPDKMSRVIATSSRIDVGKDNESQEREQVNDKKALVFEVETELSTVFHLLLGPFLSLLLLVKDVYDDSRLSQRRKNQKNNDDIRHFMSDVLGPKLRVSTIFSTAFVAPFLIDREQVPNKETKNRPSGSTKSKEQLYLPTTSVGISLLSSTSFWSNENQVQEFLGLIKSSLGLRPSSPVRSSSIMMRNKHTNSLWGTPRTPTEVMKNFQQQGRDARSYNNISETASAAMFFLGPDLASSFD